MSNTPIVFIHNGRSTNLLWAIYQAKHADPNAPVFTIGDNQRFSGLPVTPLAALAGANTEKFARVYRHMSSNSEDFERMCYLRWFYLLQFMKTRGLRDVFHYDSDALVYSKGEDIKNTLLETGQECGLSIVREPCDGDRLGVASGHASYWTVGILEQFCDFCLETFTSENYLRLYERKFAWHRANNVAGGVNDMITLFLFWLKHGRRIANFAAIRAGAVMDHNVNEPLNDGIARYQKEGAYKKIRFASGAPFFTLENNTPVRAHAIHFQGAAKAIMKNYYKGGMFSGALSVSIPLKLKTLRARAKTQARHLFRA